MSNNTKPRTFRLFGSLGRAAFAVSSILAVQSTASAAFVELHLEQFAINGPSGSGTTTWRLYAEFDDPNDQLTRVHGDSPYFSLCYASGGFYQNAYGGPTSLYNNSAFWPMIPSLAYDSYVTIGGEDSFESQTLSSTGIDFTMFESGGPLAFQNGEWTRPQNDPYAFGEVLPGMPNWQVLVGQFTTYGSGPSSAPYGVLNLDGYQDFFGFNGVETIPWSAEAVPFGTPPDEQGACCFEDPNYDLICEVLAEEVCADLGGYWYGPGTVCSDPFVECEPLDLSGACCYESAAFGLVCDVMIEEHCADLGGYWYGAGTNCSDPIVECDPLPENGACCVEEGQGSGFWYCIETTLFDCQDQLGVWYGLGSHCTDPGVNCEPITDLGACCWQDADGSWLCMEFDEYECEDLGGTWYAGLTCVDIADDCGNTDEPGACCIDEDGDGIYWCSVILQVDCQAAGGVFYGPGTICTDPMVECNEEDGACCIEEGGQGSGYWFCVEVSQQVCDNALGVWYGPGTLCTDPGVNCDIGCSSVPGADCAGKPQYQDPDYAIFGNGDIAVQTASPSIIGGSVVTVFDLSGVATAPLDSWFALNRYAHPTWNQDNLGSIFGLALDGDGNIYVSATKTWWSDQVGVSGWGAVYKIDTYSGAISTFALLPNAQDASLGSITYDCDHEQFFVTNFGDGKIYRLDMSGAIIDSFDHGTPWNGNGGWVALRDRPWAVEAHNGRLYYSMWNEDTVNYSIADFNEIRSIELDAAGGFVPGTDTSEITLPDLYQDRSSPVSDMRFSKTGSLLLAERSMQGDAGVGAHQSRLLEYECVAGSWVPSANTYEVGGSGYINSSTGGVDATYDHTWCGADAMHLPPAAADRMYGIQGLPTTGGSVANSVLIDYQDNLTNGDKTMLGDVVVATHHEPDVSCPTVQVLDVDCIGILAPWDFDITIGVSNTDPTETIISVTMTSPTGTTLTPDHVTMALPPLHSWAFDTVLEGAAQGSAVCIDMDVQFSNGEVCNETLCIDLPTCSVTGDFDFNGVVNVDDLMILIGLWGEVCDVDDNDCDVVDVDDSGVVDMGDLLVVLGNWTV